MSSLLRVKLKQKKIINFSLTLLWLLSVAQMTTEGYDGYYSLKFKNQNILSHGQIRPEGAEKQLCKVRVVVDVPQRLFLKLIVN